MKDAAIAACEIWTAVDPAGQPVSMEEKLRGGDKKIKACLMIDTLRQDEAEKLGASLAKQFPAAEVGVFRVLCQLGQWRSLMQSLLPLAEKIAGPFDRAQGDHGHCRILDRRADRGSLARVPGASAYFLGGAVVYTRASRLALLGISDAEMEGLRASTEAYALLCARRMRERHGATWGLGETGAAGPTGNRYGDAAGHSCMAISGVAERAITLETGSADRRANMDAFAKRALELFLEAIAAGK